MRRSANGQLALADVEQAALNKPDLSIGTSLDVGAIYSLGFSDIFIFSRRRIGLATASCPRPSLVGCGSGISGARGGTN
jgi:hypothetical protein